MLRLNAKVLASPVPTSSEHGKAGYPRVCDLWLTTAGEVIPGEAEAVKAIYAAFLRGDSLHGIARALSGSQIDGEGADVPRVPLHSRTIVLERNARRLAESKDPRSVPEDKPWSPSTVLGILRDPRYAWYSVYTSKDTRRQKAGESRRKALRDNLVKMANSSLDSGRPSPQPINGGRFRISLMILLASRTAADPLCASTWGRGFTGAESVASQCGLVLATTHAKRAISIAHAMLLTNLFVLSSLPGFKRRISNAGRNRQIQRSRTQSPSALHSNVRTLLVRSGTTTPRLSRGRPCPYPRHCAG